MNNWCICWFSCIPLNAELNPIFYLLTLLGGATIVVVSRLRVKQQECQTPLIRYSITLIFTWSSLQTTPHCSNNLSYCLITPKVDGPILVQIQPTVPSPLSPFP